VTNNINKVNNIISLISIDNVDNINIVKSIDNGDDIKKVAVLWESTIITTLMTLTASILSTA
jgi:hypothetical protein